MSHPPSRKRDRWGGGVASSSGAPPKVSEQDALQALLSSAEARQEEKQQQKQQQQHQNQYKRRPDGPQDDDRRPAKRRDDEGWHNPKKEEEEDYYGPASSTSKIRDTRDDGSKGDNHDGTTVAIEKQKPNFGLSGTLSKDMKAGNTYKGVVLKFKEPPEARAPTKLWRFYVFKGQEQLDTLNVSRQSAYLFGRNEDIADIVLQHPSCSSQHAVLQYRALPHRDTGKLNCMPYLMDLESTNGSFINGVRIDGARYYQLKKGDVLKFGASTREYVLLTADTTSIGA